MILKRYSNLDMTGNQITRVVIELVSTLPVTDLNIGRIVYLTTDDKFYSYTSNGWKEVTPDMFPGYAYFDTEDDNTKQITKWSEPGTTPDAEDDRAKAVDEHSHKDDYVTAAQVATTLRNLRRFDDPSIDNSKNHYGYPVYNVNGQLTSIDTTKIVADYQWSDLLRNRMMIPRIAENGSVIESPFFVDGGWYKLTTREQWETVIPTSGCVVENIKHMAEYILGVAYANLGNGIFATNSSGETIWISTTVGSAEEKLLSVTSNGVQVQLNVTTTVDSNSTDTQIPTAKAVYDALSSSSKATYDAIKNNSRSYGIFDLNPYHDVKNSLQHLLCPLKDNIANTVVGFLWFSDIHGDSENLERIMTVRNEFSDYISDTICTGDIVTSKNTEDISWWDEAGAEDVLISIGNHDCTNGSSDVGKLASYNMWFKDKISNWSVTQPSNAATNGYCYYHKDYAAASLRLICIDAVHWDSTQKTWFESVLADALSSDLSVVCLSHYVPGLANTGQAMMNTTFGQRSVFTGIIAGSGEPAQCVQTFKDNGGKFICWLCGHEHKDEAYKLKDYPNQLVLCITLAKCANISNISNRVKNTKSQDAFNFISFDTKNGIIKMCRIGDDLDVYMRRRKTVCIDYNAGNVLYNEAQKSAPRIISGKIEVLINEFPEGVPANGYVTKTISFGSNAFSEPPTIVIGQAYATAVDPVPYYKVYALVYAYDENGFTVRITNNTDIIRWPKFDWIAVDKHF